MTDLIRKAVELADGWSLGEFGDQSEMVSTKSLPSEPLWNLSQEYKDALAAQLVRQVDAIDADDRHVFFESAQGLAVVRIYDEYMEADDEYRVGGSGRTMNTIKAIVESGVLE